MDPSEVTIELLADDEVTPPHYATDGASGADVRAHIPEEIVLMPGCSALVPTGQKMAIPPNYEIQVRPRSGLAAKHGVTVLNTPGTIDSDYRGEIKIILINHGSEPFVIQPGMRIAQFVICPVVKAHFVRRKELQATARDSGGFGHTGIE